MKKTTLLFILTGLVLSWLVGYCLGAENVPALVNALSSPDSKLRTEAAASLKQVLAANPSARTNDHGKEYWELRAESVKPGMKHSEVIQLLPPFDKTIPADRLLWSGPGSGDSHYAMWRLDHYWTVSISYRNPDTVIRPPTLRRNTMRFWVKPPKDYSGTWVTWYVNGCMCSEKVYRNGKSHGAQTRFYDNEKISHRKHYENGVCSGTDSGWHADGNKRYQGTYLGGKRHGVWTHWFRDGTLHTRDEYSFGKPNGLSVVWYKDGKKEREVSYDNGKKHGTDIGWDASGKLLWTRHFENGRLIE